MTIVRITSTANRPFTASIRRSVSSPKMRKQAERLLIARQAANRKRYAYSPLWEECFCGTVSRWTQIPKSGYTARVQKIHTLSLISAIRVPGKVKWMKWQM